MKRYTLGLCALLVTVACGGDAAAPKTKSAPKTSGTAATEKVATKAPETTKKKASSSSTKTWDSSMGKATVKGMISFEGAAPERKLIDMGSDANCHADGAREEGIVVNNGGLANVVLSFTDGYDGFKFPAFDGTVELHQNGCVYRPHVLAMQAGASIKIVNDDKVVHNVHSYSKRNSSFNQAQPAGAPAIVKDMKRKDKLFPIKCDMHAWMNCQVVVFDHPFFAVSDENGAYMMANVPAGTYTVRAEHETLGSQTGSVTVDADGTATLNFSFSLSE